MDKSWINAHIKSTTYRKGVESFIDFARARDIRESIICPCLRCCNDELLEVEEVHDHLLRYGFLLGYTIWTIYGELATPPTSQSTSVHETSFVKDDMIGLVRDAFGLSSSPLNHENTKEEMLDGEEDESAETSDHNVEDIPYKKLLEQCDEELYPSCKFSSLSFTLRLYHIKCIGGISNKAFGMIIELLRDAFPHITSLPSSAHQTKKLTNDLGLGYKKIHACPNDCMLYWDKSECEQSCHTCKASRYRSDGDQLGESSNSRKSIGKLRHPRNGLAWKAFNDRYPKLCSCTLVLVRVLAIYIDEVTGPGLFYASYQAIFQRKDPMLHSVVVIAVELVYFDASHVALLLVTGMKFNLNVIFSFVCFNALFMEQIYKAHLSMDTHKSNLFCHGFETATWKMFRSKATMEQHAKKYTQNKNNSTRMESHMQTIGNLHDDSHRPSSFSHTLFRPPFCSTIQQNCFPSSSSADFQSIRSNPTTYNPNLYDSMIHHSTSSSYSKPTTFEPKLHQSTSSYSKPTTFEPMLHQSTSSSYSKPSTFEPMLHQSTSSSYSKPTTFEPMLHPSTSTLSDQPSSSRTSLHQFSSSFHLNQDDEDEDEDEIDEESKEVEIVDEYGSILRVQKMTAKDVYKLTEGEKVLVHVNDSFQLIKGAAGVCTRFMTILLSKPNLCPPEAKDWREIKARCGTLLLGELRRKFSLPQVSDLDDVLFAMFGVKVRYTKHRFKMKLFRLAAKKLDEANNVGANGELERTYTDDQLLQALDLIDAPPNFLHHQWELYKSNLRTPLAKKTKHKRSPNRIEFFDLSYQSRDGSYIHGMSKDFMERAREEMTRRELEISKSRPVDDEVRSEIADAVMMDLIGPDKPGQAHGYGTGVTKSKVTKLSLDLRRSRKESLVNQNRLLLEKLDSQGRNRVTKQSNQDYGKRS
ncbi:tetratricopeptide-like helical domain, DYW domain protein [Tanacetum coccineum]